MNQLIKILCLVALQVLLAMSALSSEGSFEGSGGGGPRDPGLCIEGESGGGPCSIKLGDSAFTRERLSPWKANGGVGGGPRSAY